MSDPKEQLKAMVQDLIADRNDSADAKLHDYLVTKTQEMAGLAPAPSFDDLADAE